MVLGPAALALAGVVIGAFPKTFETALGSGAASAVLARPVVMDLKLWHGLNLDALLVLALSLLTLAAGVGVYLVVRRGLVTAAQALEPTAGWGPERLFEGAMDGLPRAAGLLTRRLQTGVLRHYLMVTVIAAVALTTPSLARWALGSLGAQVPPATLFDLMLAVLVAAGALAAALLRSRLASVAALGVTGLAMALIFVLYSAPDLAMTQVMVETLSVIVLVLVFARLPRLVRRSGVAQRLRDLVIAGALGVAMTLLILASATVDLDRQASSYYLATAVPEAKGRNVVNVILVDFRALDTLGEITVVAVAGLGVAALIGWRFGLAGRRP
jgi:multicomponent Na+:H+ antiporter subunit A